MQVSNKDVQAVQAIKDVIVVPYLDRVKAQGVSVRLSCEQWREVVLALEFKAECFGYIEVKDRKACFDLAKEVRQKSDCYKPESDV